MSLRSWKLLGALLLASSSVSAVSAPLVLHDTLSVQSFGWYIVISSNQHPAYRISHSAGAVTVSQVALSMRLASGASGWPSVRVCADGPGGARPNLADCATFTPLDPVTNSFAPARFQGSKKFTAGQAIWVVAKSLVPADEYWWAMGPGPSTSYASTNSGSTWLPVVENYGLRVEAVTAVAATPASVPTLTEFGLLLMSSLLAAAAWVVRSRGWVWRREKAC
ncbi:hypothetical protein [Paenacidovorax monticola]|uniref:hypothetical protein n=1 Tax=Paenacidovorax monticola TaxID=1926868 RepID=UPI00336A2C2A